MEHDDVVKLDQQLGAAQNLMKDASVRLTPPAHTCVQSFPKTVPLKGGHAATIYSLESSTSMSLFEVCV